MGGVSVVVVLKEESLLAQRCISAETDRHCVLRTAYNGFLIGSKTARFICFLSRTGAIKEKQSRVSCHGIVTLMRNQPCLIRLHSRGISLGICPLGAADADAAAAAQGTGGKAAYG